MTQNFFYRLSNASDSIKQGAPKSGNALITNLSHPQCGYISHMSMHDLEA